jgi:thymidylate synthase
MAKIDITYHNLLKKILQEGYTYEDPNRKGVNRIEIPSYTFRHEFKDGFPAITTKKLNYKAVVTELIWFLRGDTNIKYLIDNDVNIWNKDAYNYYLKKCKENKIIPVNNNDFIKFTKQGNVKDYFDKYTFGDLGKVYGHYWRNFNDVDQIAELIKNMISKPMSSELIISARNPSDKDNQALPCCHYGFQIVVRPLSNITERHLHNYEYGFELHWQQRSVDTFLGLPFNMTSYATLALILEKITGYKALAIQGDLKKVHLYDNSLDAVKEQLSRDVNQYDKCELKMDTLTEVQFQSGIKYINEIEPGSFKLVNYESYPYIKVEMLSRNE